MWVRSDAREARWSQLVRISTEPDFAIQRERERERNRSVNFHALFVSMRRWKCIQFSFNQNKPKLKNSQRTNSNDKQNPTPESNHKLSFPKLKPGITHNKLPEFFFLEEENPKWKARITHNNLPENSRRTHSEKPWITHPKSQPPITTHKPNYSHPKTQLPTTTNKPAKKPTQL